MVWLRWRLSAQDSAIVRYCHGCGQATAFRASGKVRRNANGKHVYQFEIYKCRRDHTWNRRVPPTAFDTVDPTSRNTLVTTVGRVPVDQWQSGVTIEIEAVTGRWRLDKTLTDQLDQLSRGRLVRMIAAGEVMRNGSPVERDRLLRPGDIITILPSRPEWR